MKRILSICLLNFFIPPTWPQTIATGIMHITVTDPRGKAAPADVAVFLREIVDGRYNLMPMCSASAAAGPAECPRLSGGQYIVIATPIAEAPIAGNNAGQTEEQERAVQKVFPLTFAPGSALLSMAEPVEVRPGSTTDVRIRVKPQDARSVILQLAPSVAPDAVRVTQLGASSLPTPFLRASNASSGSLALTALPAAPLRISAQWFAGGQEHHASVDVDTAVSDPLVKVSLNEAAYSTVRLKLKSLPQGTDINQASVILYRIDGLRSEYLSSPVEKGQMATFHDVPPGKYAVRLKGAEAVCDRIEINGVGNIQTLNLNGQADSVTGTIETSAVSSAFRARIKAADSVEFSQIGIVLRSQDGLLEMARPDQAGVVSFGPQRTGTYQIAAWRNIDQVPFRESVFIEEHASDWTTVTFNPARLSEMIDISLH